MCIRGEMKQRRKRTDPLKPLGKDFAPSDPAEREVTVCLRSEDGLAHICSCWSKWTRRFVRRYGHPKDVTTKLKGQVTSAFWTIPENLITFRRPRKPK